jgi:hypothetical protein
MISGRMGDDAFGRLCIRQTQDRIARPSGLECKTVLQIFAFEAQTAPQLLMKVPRIDDRGQQDMRPNPFFSHADIFKVNTERLDVCCGRTIQHSTPKRTQYRDRQPANVAERRKASGET